MNRDKWETAAASKALCPRFPTERAGREAVGRFPISPRGEGRPTGFHPGSEAPRLSPQKVWCLGEPLDPWPAGAGDGGWVTCRSPAWDSWDGSQGTAECLFQSQ